MVISQTWIYKSPTSKFINIKGNRFAPCAIGIQEDSFVDFIRIQPTAWQKETNKCKHGMI